MIGLDTTVVVRYVMQDEPAQAGAANHILDGLTDSSQGFVSTVTLVEIYWVLRRAYRVDRAATASVLQGLLESSEIVLEEPDAVRRALRQVARGADFADALIAQLGIQAGCDHTVTFDRTAARLPGMRLLT